MKKNIGAKLGIYPTPVVVVGTYDKNDSPNIATLAWAGVCCSEPPQLQIALRKSRYTHAAILQRGVFSVNIPSEKYLTETDYAGITSGKNVDKFEATGLTPVRGEILHVPLVLEFPISMECKVAHTLELGSHDLFIGEIIACWVESEAIQETDRLDPKKINPLAFTPNGEYYGLADFLALSHNAGRKLLSR